jgi:CubicO group peptidase (beta-lactamase class C family)
MKFLRRNSTHRTADASRGVRQGVPARRLAAGLLLLALTGHALAADITELMTEGRVPGLAIGVIHDGRLQLSNYGVRDTGSGAPVDAETVFEAASLGKPVFAYVVLQLIDAGTLSLDQKVADILPHPAPGDARAAQITVREILSHSSGLPNWRHGRLRTYFDPGTRFSYSGEGFVLLQRAVEKITGETLETLAKRLVFEPLGMRSTSYVWQAWFEDDYAAPHDIASRPGIRRRITAAVSASSLQTTAADYGRFLAAVIEGKRLKPETAKLWLTPASHVPQGCGHECLRPTTPEPDPDLGWGLGWGLEEAEGTFFQWGDNSTFMAYAAGSMASHTAVVVFSNSANGQSIMPDLVTGLLPGPHPSFAWLAYEHFDTARRRLLWDALARGIETAWGNGDPAAALSEVDRRSLARDLLQSDRRDDALWLARRNAADFPGSSAVFKDLGRTLLALERQDEALLQFRQAAELDPGDNQTRQFIKKLESPTLNH